MLKSCRTMHRHSASRWWCQGATNAAGCRAALNDSFVSTGNVCVRSFSSNILGHNPMAGAMPVGDKQFKGPTAREVEISGGVWAPSNAKRDKIRELKLALAEGQETLDDAANPLEQYDLWLADGLMAIAKSADTGCEIALVKHHTDEFDKWLAEKEKELPKELTQDEFKSHMKEASQILAGMAMSIPSDRCMRLVRDFYEWQGSEDQVAPPQQLGGSASKSFDFCVARHRLGLSQAAADTLSTSWDILTTVTDADMDRAAVSGKAREPQANTLPLKKTHAVLRSFATGSCKNRVEALWDLMDADNDGLLDQVEMTNVANLALSPVQAALESLFQDAIKAHPVRSSLSENDELTPPPARNWRARRRENKVQRRLTKTFVGAIKTHFDVDIEMPHRLRCIYAWAEKAHQDNKIESVLLDSHDAASALGMGRKRYVELEPKIAIHEFVEMQEEHFGHLDRAGLEIIKSFREDLWVQQGKGRQNRELQRDCVLFLASVSIVDAFIMWL